MSKKDNVLKSSILAQTKDAIVVNSQILAIRDMLNTEGYTNWTPNLCKIIIIGEQVNFVYKNSEIKPLESTKVVDLITQELNWIKLKTKYHGK